MSLCVIGIDAGATKTLGYLANDNEQLLAEAHAPGANFHTSPPHAVESVFRNVFETLTKAADTSSLAAVCIGMAGVDRGDEAQAVRELLYRIGCTAPVVVGNDALIALRAGAGDQPGLVVISGTGSIVYGCNASMQAARAGGWGHIIGDEGSGYWMGREALASVVREADGRGPSTWLTLEVLAHFNIKHADGLPPIVYDQVLPRTSVAALGPIIQRALDRGDAVAASIVGRAADELAIAARSVGERLRLKESAGVPIILSGGAFRAVPSLGRELQTRLERIFVTCDVQSLAREPALGAVRIALAAARGRLSLPQYV